MCSRAIATRPGVSCPALSDSRWSSAYWVPWWVAATRPTTMLTLPNPRPQQARPTLAARALAARAATANGTNGESTSGSQQGSAASAGTGAVPATAAWRGSSRQWRRGRSPGHDGRLGHRRHGRRRDRRCQPATGWLASRTALSAASRPHRARRCRCVPSKAAVGETASRSATAPAPGQRTAQTSASTPATTSADAVGRICSRLD